jgi:hypothetical protein
MLLTLSEYSQIFMSIIFHHYKQLLKLKEEEAMARVIAKGEVKAFAISFLLLLLYHHNKLLNE